MIIDTHTHVDDPEILRSYLKKAKNKVNLAFVLHWYKDDLEKTLGFIESKPNLKLIPSVKVDGPENMRQQLEFIDKLLKEGRVIGIKLYPGYQHFYVSEERINPVAELCLKYDKPMVVHAGDVYDGDKEANLKYSHPVYIDELAMRFPKLKIIIAHFGFPHLLECANIVSKNENVYTDISGTINDDLSQKEAVISFKQYKNDLQRVFNYFPDIKNKIMFGTDYGTETASLNEVELYIKLVKKLFTKKEQELVFSGLAEKLFLE